MYQYFNTGCPYYSGSDVHCFSYLLIHRFLKRKMLKISVPMWFSKTTVFSGLQSPKLPKASLLSLQGSPFPNVPQNLSQPGGECIAILGWHLGKWGTSVQPGRCCRQLGKLPVALKEFSFPLLIFLKDIPDIHSPLISERGTVLELNPMDTRAHLYSIVTVYDAFDNKSVKPDDQQHVNGWKEKKQIPPSLSLQDQLGLSYLIM